MSLQLCVTCDEQPRAETIAESLAGLKPAVDRDGTVTAGHASALNDGAAALVLILARVSGLGSAGVDPAFMARCRLCGSVWVAVAGRWPTSI